jgi:uncharacterized protein (TIGR02246 family)
MQRQNGQTKTRRIRGRVGLVSVTAVLTAATVITVGAGGIATAKDKEPTEAEIAALFDGWNRALRSGDPEEVAARYAPDAVLLPTASSQIRTTHDGIVDYFEHFQENDPVGEKTRTIVNVLDADSAIDAGTYVFTLTDPGTGEVREVEARYSYEYEKVDDEWLIVNHHSSVTPAEG